MIKTNVHSYIYAHPSTFGVLISPNSQIALQFNFSVRNGVIQSCLCEIKYSHLSAFDEMSDLCDFWEKASDVEMKQV